MQAYDLLVRARSSALVLLLAAAGAFAATQRGQPPSPAERAIPGADPALLGAPPGAPDLPLPLEQVSVRVRRAADGRVPIVEFLSPGVSEPQQVRLRLDFAAGALRVAAEGAGDQESWTTTLLRSR